MIYTISKNGNGIERYTLRETKKILLDMLKTEPYVFLYKQNNNRSTVTALTAILKDGKLDILTDYKMVDGGN